MLKYTNYRTAAFAKMDERLAFGRLRVQIQKLKIDCLRNKARVIVFVAE